ESRRLTGLDINAFEPKRMLARDRSRAVAVHDRQRAFDVAEAGGWRIDDTPVDKIAPTDILDRKGVADQVPDLHLTDDDALDEADQREFDDMLGRADDTGGFFQAAAAAARDQVAHRSARAFIDRSAI